MSKNSFQTAAPLVAGRKHAKVQGEAQDPTESDGPGKARKSGEGNTKNIIIDLKPIIPGMGQY
jgi:hypothetical protein